MNYGDISLSDFVYQLSTKAPVPGGGGASALVAAVGSALGCMVGSLTVGKKKYAEAGPDITRLMDQSLSLEQHLLSLIDKDAEAFEPLSRAYSLPSKTEEEKAHKAVVMEEALTTATLAPLEIMESCGEALELVSEYAIKGSTLAISDAGVAAALCVSALKGASLNVFINTKSMKNREFADQLNEKAFALLDKYVAMGDCIFNDVQKRLMK